MNKLTKKLFVSALSAVMAFSTMTISASAATKISVPKSVTVYTNSSASISIPGLGTAKNKITKSSIKSSNNNVAEPSALTTNVNTYSYKSEPLTKGGSPYSSSSNSNSQSIELWTKKPGTATVSFKIGSKSYKTKVTILKYANPIKSIVLTGANGNKNFASKTKSSSYGSVKLAKKTQSKAWLTVTAASGWKISYANIGSENGNNAIHYYSSPNKPVSSLTMGAGTIKKGGYISVTLINTKTNANLNVYYDLT